MDFSLFQQKHSRVLLGAIAMRQSKRLLAEMQMEFPDHTRDPSKYTKTTLLR